MHTISIERRFIDRNQPALGVEKRVVCECNFSTPWFLKDDEIDLAVLKHYDHEGVPCTTPVRDAI